MKFLLKWNYDTQNTNETNCFERWRKKSLSKQREEKNSSIRNVNVIKIKELRGSGKQYRSKYVLPVGVENASVNVIKNGCMCALFIRIVWTIEFKWIFAWLSMILVQVFKKKSESLVCVNTSVDACVRISWIIKCRTNYHTKAKKYKIVKVKRSDVPFIGVIDTHFNESVLISFCFLCLYRHFFFPY